MRASTHPWSQHLAPALGFVLGLGCAVAFGWRTSDLIWSLWLSSLVIGYATIVAGIGGAVVRQARAGNGAVAVAGGLFALLFFTFHYGLFHFVHSMFLGFFFPLQEGQDIGVPPYGLVFARYWPWLIAAVIAEREVLRDAARGVVRGPFAAAGGSAAGFNPMPAYANVLRMHLLIFVFAGLYLLGLEHIVVYALVYAVYFWPWRRGGAVAAPTA